MDNVFFFKKISAIGGVESFFYYLSCLFKNMVVYYEEGDREQIKRLSKNIEVHRWYGERVKCKRFFGNYGLETILPHLEAEEKYFIIHCDYKKNKLIKPMVYPGFKCIGVSKLACRSFTELTGIEAELIYNPIVINKPKVKKKTDKIHIICPQRVSSEKGGWRIDKMSEILDNANLDYDITLYTNKYNKLHFPSPNVIVKKHKLDLSKEISEATYLMLLSDHEAFGLSVGESLTLGTPVIVTDIEAFHEIGCVEGKNAIFVDLNMKNVDVDLIKKGLPSFTYTPPKSNWDKYLDNNSNYNPNELVEVEVLKRKLWDLETDKHYVRGEIATMTKTRKAELESLGYVR